MRRRLSRFIVACAAVAAPLALGPGAGAAITDHPLPVSDPGVSRYHWESPIASWNGAMWVAPQKLRALIRIGMDGQVSQVPVPMHPDPANEEGPSTLSVGAEGLWFLQQAGRIAAVLMPDGGVSGFLTGGFVGANTLAARPSGGVYVASNLGETVRFVTPDGFRDHPREHGDQPVLAVDARGVGWFAEEGRLVRMNDDGSLSPFPLRNTCAPSVGCALPAVTGLAAGPDGHLWYTRSGLRSRSTGPYSGTTTRAAVVGRMTATGAVREWDLANMRIGPSGIVAGPDRNLWFTTTDGLGRVTPTGRVRLLRLPGGRSADSIAFGPDRAIWFIDASLNRVSRITMAEANALGGAEIRSTTLRRRAGAVAVRLRCPAGGARCTGRVTLAAIPNPDAVFGRRQSWGAKRFALRAGRATTVRVTPTAALNARLRRAAKVPTRVEIDRGRIQGETSDTTIRR